MESTGSHDRLLDSAKDAGRLNPARAAARKRCHRLRAPGALAFFRPRQHRRCGGRHLDSVAAPDRFGDVRARKDSGQFGLVDIAIRTLEVYATATLEAAVSPRAPKPVACVTPVAARAGDVSLDRLRTASPYFRTATRRADPDRRGGSHLRRTPGDGSNLGRFQAVRLDERD
jgi:hypothetical protein